MAYRRRQGNDLVDHMARSAEQGEFFTLATKETIRFVKRRPVAVSLYLVGLLAAGLGTGFVASEAATRVYYDGLEHANHVTRKDLARAQQELRYADQQYYDAKGWFWQCDNHCMQMYDRYLQAKGKVDHIQYERDELLKKARQEVGVWSTIGVSEVRKQFWHVWEQAKTEAKRWTMIDGFFMAVGGREEKLATVIFKLILQYLINITIAFMLAFIRFMFAVYYLITGYGESFASGFLFFALVLIAGLSVIVSFVGAMYGAVGAGAYVLQQQEARRRLHGGGAQRQRVRGDHYD